MSAIHAAAVTSMSTNAAPSAEEARITLGDLSTVDDEQSKVSLPTGSAIGRVAGHHCRPDDHSVGLLPFDEPQV
jgi:hypothetical protein